MSCIISCVCSDCSICSTSCLVTLFDEGDIYSDPADLSLLRFQLQTLMNAVDYRESQVGLTARRTPSKDRPVDELAELRQLRMLEAKMVESLEFLRAQRAAVERALSAEVRGLERENDQPPRGFDRSAGAEKAE